MATNAITLSSTALFGNPLWANSGTTPLANSAIPAAIASATPIYKISTTQSAELLLPLSALSLSAYITSLQVIVTQGTQSGTPNLPTLVSLGVKSSTGIYQYTNPQPLVLGGVNTLTFLTKPDGTAWTPSDIVNSVIKIIDQSTSGLGNLSSLSINAISTTIPTVSINPITNITSSTPTITWTYADGDLALQSGYQVQVVDQVTGAAVIDSGFVSGLDTAYQIPANVTVDNHITASITAFNPLSGTTGTLAGVAWTYVATSSNGQTVYGATNNSGVYKSTDYGKTFTLLAETTGVSFKQIACSADGLILYGVANGSNSGIYSPITYVSGGDATTSSAIVYSGGDASTTVFANTLDAGTASSQTTSLSIVAGTSGYSFVGLATSSTGSIVYATSNNGGIFVSTNSGASFVVAAGTGSLAFGEVTCSADGTKAYAVVPGGSIYASTDSGTTWTALSGTNGIRWSDITCSSDAVNVYATATNGYIYASSNSGATFTPVTGTNLIAWVDIACSADGTHVYATVNNGGIWASSNSASSFVIATAPTNQMWTSIVTTPSSSYIYASSSNGYIWVAGLSLPYKYQVRVTKNVNGYNNYTAYSSFIPTSIAYNDTPPTFSVALTGHNPTFTINVPDVSTLGYTTRNIVVLRLWSGGYGVVRNGNITNVGLGASTITFTDYENPTDTILGYKIKAEYFDASGNAYVGSANYGSVVIPQLPSWWLQKTDGSDSGIPVNVLLSGGLAVNRTRPQTHLYPLGSRYPITVSGTVQGYDGDMTVYFDNNPAWLNFLPYLDYIGKLLISAPNGAQKYVTLDKNDVSKALGRGTDILRDMKLTYTEEDSGLGFNEPTVYEF